MNLCPKEEKFMHIYLVILKNLKISNLKEDLSCSDNFHAVLPKYFEMTI
jgi:hypothetical protein